MHDVIVAGAGPVGSQVASRLAAGGFDVAVLERHPRSGNKQCCTGIIGAACARTFGVNRETILRQANSAQLVSPSGKTIRVWRRDTQAVILDRARFDAEMAKRASAAGATVLFDHEVTRIKINPDNVTAETRQGQVSGRVAVVAAGFASALGRNLGMGTAGDFVTGAQADVETEVAETEVYFGRNVAPGFFAWLVPSSPGRGRVGLLSRGTPALHLRSLLQSLKAEGKIGSSEALPHLGGIPLKPLRRTYSDRVLVVGDAAGQVKPTTGGGIYYGLLCADIAAGVLGSVLAADDLSARSLSRYEREWKKKLSRELAIGYRARRLYERLSDSQVDRIFDIIKSRGIDTALLQDSDLSFDWHGEVLLRLLGHRAVSRAVSVIRNPFALGWGTFAKWRRSSDEQRPRHDSGRS